MKYYDIKASDSLFPHDSLLFVHLASSSTKSCQRKKKEINTNWKFVFKSCTWVWAYKYRLRTIIIIKESATWSELITQQEKKPKNKPPPIKPLVYNPPDWLSAMVICNTLFYALHWVRQFFFLSSLCDRQCFSPPIVFL